MTRRGWDGSASGGLTRSSRDSEPNGVVRFTVADGYRTVTSVLMSVLGAVILVRTLAFGVHLMAVLVGLGFIVLGAYRLAFVVAYLRRVMSR